MSATVETILVRRKIFSPESTIGEMYGPDGFFWCHTLEDVVRNVKVYGKTAIPAGTYGIGWIWWEKRGRMVPILKDVPFYTGILIHGGFDAGYTEGCLTVGNAKPGVPDKIFNSPDVVPVIEANIRKLTDKGPVAITIEGGFEAKDWVKGA